MSETELAEVPEGNALPETEAPVEEPQDELTHDVAGESDDDDSEARPKPKNGIQQRISQVVAERNEARERAKVERERNAVLERRVDEMMEMVMSRQAAEAPQPVATPQQPPMREQFEDDAAYWQAANKYVAAIASAEARAESARMSEAQQAAVREQSFREREAEFAAQQADYYEVAHRPNVPFTGQIAELIKTSDVGPELAYHLAKNRDAVTKLASLPPVTMARELGRIEARILAAKEAPKSPAKAPPPAPPPKLAAGDADVGKPMSQWTDAEFKRWREREIAKRR